MKRPIFLKQKIMLKVLIALIPIFLVSIYFYGWRFAALVAVTAAAGLVTEWITASQRNGKISQACFVTTALLGISLPPTTPFWIAAVAAVVAILFGKEAFGGFGRNVFNPAIVGRAFVYVCFPPELTARFVPVFKGFPGGFEHWSFSAQKSAPLFMEKAGLSLVDAVSAATPMWARRDFGFTADISQLFFGNIGQVFNDNGTVRMLSAGSGGEVCAAAILLGALYLIATRTAQWRLMAATIAGACGLNLILRHLLGIDAMPPLFFTLFSGALLYAAVFMVTDPVSAPKLTLSQWIYGAFIGAMVVFFRYKAIFAGGVAFAILLGNMLAPSLDLWIRHFKSRGSSGEAS